LNRNGRLIDKAGGFDHKPASRFPEGSAILSMIVGQSSAAQMPDWLL
jgi:hypothetical protein